MGDHVFYKMAAIVAINLFGLARAHEEHFQSSNERSDDNPDVRFNGIPVESEKISRRSVVAREWQYEGIPIEFPFRRNAEPEQKTVTRTSRPNAIPPVPSPTPPSPPNDRRYRRIFNPDEIAAIEEFPFMAALLVNKELWCGAAIIDKDRVLTAAHCLQLQYNNRFFREYVKMLTVRVGSANATSGGEELRVSEILFHPNYKPMTLEFNFAVLKLHKNISFTRESAFVGKIKYTRNTIVPVNNKILFLGWGSVLGYSGMGGQVLLQKLELPIYDLADCQDVYGRNLVTRNNFCAGYITLAKNVCNHDAGGPAIMDGRLVGILSFSSKRCDQGDQPAVFSNVGAVAEWLEKLDQRREIRLKSIPTMEAENSIV